MDGVRTGGCSVRIEGQARGFRSNTNKETGEVGYAGSVLFWGGDRYIRLESNQHLDKLKDGAWVVLEAPLVKYGKNDGLGAAKVVSVEVNGKKVV